MGEKNNAKNILSGFFLLIIFGWVVFFLFIFFKLSEEKTLTTYKESLLIIASRGRFGNIEKISFGENLPNKYLHEIIGDTHYQRGQYSDAIRSYEEALMIEKDSFIEQKISLLKNRKSETSSGNTSQSGSANEILENTLDRIQKNESNRGKYIGNGQTYSQILPSFQVDNKEVIDW
ncbi:MAG: hypothetical protein HHAS10_03780 [Candidatus Altimarinota bacterium]